MENSKIINHFKRYDPVIYGLISTYGFVQLTSSSDYFGHLAESIISQQLSEKAGATIWKRFLALFPSGEPTPAAVDLVPATVIRSCGTSTAKAKYIKNAARAFLNHAVMPEKFGSMSDEEIIIQLTKIKGVGRWTAEMFAIFSLGRQDIFSPGDAGLARAMGNLYGRGEKLSKSRIEKIVGVWSPYRSYACLMLWKSLENT